jgi:hypothetical protein
MVYVKKALRFSVDESGAVTVDWVVLTAAIVGIGLAILGTTAGGITAASVNVAEDIELKQAAASNLHRLD